MLSFLQRALARANSATKLSGLLLLILVLSACGGGGSSSSGTDDSDSSASDSSTSDSSTDASEDSSGDDSDSTDSDSSSNEDIDVLTATVDTSICASTTESETIACAANNWLATLSSSELSDAQLEWSDSETRTRWSNLPVGGVTRNGLALLDMDDDSKEAALILAKSVLSDAGYEDMIAGFAADEYLQTLGANGYDKEYYYFAIFGYPDAANDWMLQIGGHHMAYNITFLSGSGYPTPHHMGAEPKVTFTVDSNDYSVLEDEAEAFLAMYGSFSESELDFAYLDGQSFSDVLMGPDNGSGELPDDYPAGANRGGILVSDLSSAQQALVTAAIASYVADYTSSISDPLLEDYTSAAAFADTYVAWAGSQSAGVDIDTNGTYMRIDGPRLWIEIVCQGGVVIRNATHYHTIFRDKTFDYGNAL